LNPVILIKQAAPAEATQLNLLLIAGENNLCYALQNNVTKEITGFAFYSFAGKDISVVDFIEAEELFSGNYFNSVVAFQTAEAMLVPASHFNAIDTTVQMNAAFGRDESASTLMDWLAGQQAYLVYRVPETLHAAVKKKINPGKIMHINEAFISPAPGTEADHMQADFRSEDFSVTVVKDGQLQLVQCYAYSTPEDVLYFLLKICNSFGFSQQTVPIRLAGLIEKDSALYRELFKYFIHIELEELPGSILLAEELREYPLHYFSSICKLAACVS
jgi:hypothetical protein